MFKKALSLLLAALLIATSLSVAIISVTAAEEDVTVGAAAGEAAALDENADKLTVKAVSNYFGEAETVYSEEDLADDNTVTVNYTIQSDTKNLLNADWLLTYDGEVLKLKEVSMPVFPSAIINTNPKSVEYGAKGAYTDLQSVDISEKTGLVKAVFEVLNPKASAEVNLQVNDLKFTQIPEGQEYSTSENEEKAVTNGVVNSVADIDTGIDFSNTTEEETTPEEFMVVTAKSNYFLTESMSFNKDTLEANDNKVTVTFDLKTSQKLISSNWLLKYDKDVLALESAGMPAVSDAMINTASESGVRGTCTNLNGYDLNGRHFVEAVFNVPEFVAGETEVYLEVIDLKIADIKDGEESTPDKETKLVNVSVPVLGTEEAAEGFSSVDLGEPEEEETTAPGETTVPEETTAPEDTTAPAETMTVKATSNYFPETEKTYTAEELTAQGNKVVVEYKLNSDAKLVNLNWTLSYDNSVLTADKVTMPVAPDALINMDPESKPDNTVKGNCTNLMPYSLKDANGNDVIVVKAEFTVPEFKAGETTVDLMVHDLKVTHLDEGDTHSKPENEEKLIINGVKNNEAKSVVVVSTEIAYEDEPEQTTAGETSEETTAEETTAEETTEEETTIEETTVEETTIAETTVETDLTVTATSNFFPETSKTYENTPNGTKVTVEYNLSAPGMNIINFDIDQLTWDPSVLKLTEVTFPFAGDANVPNQITEPGRYVANYTSVNPAAPAYNTDGTPVTVVKAVFDVLNNMAGETTVDLKMDSIGMCGADEPVQLPVKHPVDGGVINPADKSLLELTETLIDGEGTIAEETTEEETSEETTAEDTTVEDTTAEDTTAEDTTAEDTTVEDTTVEDTTAEDTTVEDTTAEDTTAEDTTADDTTVEDTTVEDKTVEDTTAEEGTTQAPVAELNVTSVSNYSASPAPQTVNVGDNVTVRYVVPVTMDIVSFQFGASFPTDKLQLVSVEGFAPDMLFNNNAETFNVTGAVSKIDGYSVAEGDMLVSFTFKAIGEGDAEVDLNVIDLLKKAETGNVPVPVVINSVIQPTQQEDTTAPAEDTTAPAEDTTAPAEDTTAPAEDTTAPAEDTTAPAEDTTAHAEDTTAPAEDTTAPAEDTTAPAEDTTAPAEDTTAPAEDTTAPAEDTTAPAEDTTAPAEDTTAPAAGGYTIESNLPGIFGDKLDLDDFTVNEDGKLVKTYPFDEATDGVELAILKDGNKVFETVFNVKQPGNVYLIYDPETDRFSIEGENVEVDVTPETTVPDASEDATSSQNPASPDSTPSQADNTPGGAVQTGEFSIALVVLIVLTSATAAIYLTRKKSN